MTNHPIQPSAQLVEQWYDAATSKDCIGACNLHTAMTFAAQWGANQELEACHEWLCIVGIRSTADRMRKTRRPNPMTKKEQALELIKRIQESKQCWELSELSVVLEVLEGASD